MCLSQVSTESMFNQETTQKLLPSRKKIEIELMLINFLYLNLICILQRYINHELFLF
jgi:hypothetical protein